MVELPYRKPNRLAGYDYSRNGAYFVTICTKDRHELFSRILNGRPILTEYGLTVEYEIKNIPKIRKECVISKFVIMPNHIHMIAQIVGGDGNRPASISNMVQGFKGAVTRRIGFSIWQRSFHDHIIRSADEYARIAEYIETNPGNWEEDYFYASDP
jgi:REP element-mobilizing transposase RayT